MLENLRFMPELLPPVRRAAEAIRAGVRAAAIAVDGVIEANVRAVVVRDNLARLRLFEDSDFRFGRLANPFDRMREPRVRRVVYVTHLVSQGGSCSGLTE